MTTNCKDKINPLYQWCPKVDEILQDPTLNLEEVEKRLKAQGLDTEEIERLTNQSI